MLPRLRAVGRVRELRDVPHKRRRIVDDRARTRNRVHQIVDRAGIPVGGILTDLFGTNGLRILDGPVEGKPTEEIVGPTTRHVAGHRAALRDAFGAALTEAERFMRAGHPDAWRRDSERIARYDALVEDRLSAHKPLPDLLVTVPGIDRTAAAAILVEPGPDMGRFPTARHCAA